MTEWEKLLDTLLNTLVSESGGGGGRFCGRRRPTSEHLAAQGIAGIAFFLTDGRVAVMGGVPR